MNRKFDLSTTEITEVTEARFDYLRCNMHDP